MQLCLLDMLVVEDLRPTLAFMENLSQDAVARDRQSASTFQELMLAVAASSLPFALIVMQSPAPYAAGIKALLAIVSGASGILALASLTILRQ